MSQQKLERALCYFGEIFFSLGFSPQAILMFFFSGLDGSGVFEIYFWDSAGKFFLSGFFGFLWLLISCLDMI